MKIPVFCLLFSTLGLSFAVPSLDFNDLKKYISSQLKDKQNEDELKVLLQAMASTEGDQDSDDNDDDAVAKLQRVFNVLAQVEVEKAREQRDKTMGMAQLWGAVGRTLWNVGKRYLKRRHCTEEQGVNALLQELVGEQGIQEIEDDGDDKARAELQTLFQALNQVEAKAMQADNAQAERWWRRVKRWAGGKARKLTRRYLC